MPVNEKIPFVQSTLETIDYAVYDWLNEITKINAKTNKGWKKVPITWVTAERAFHIKNNKDIRDSRGSLILPLITIERASINKDMTKKGAVWANIPPVPDAKGGSFTIARQIKQDKTANFRNADTIRKNNDRVGSEQENFPSTTSGVLYGKPKDKNNKIVYETITVPQPVYIEIQYNIGLRAEYQQQMNDMLTPFVTRPGAINYILLKRENHTYEGFVDSNFAQDTNLLDLGEEERRFETIVSLRVLGYLIGDGPNQEKPIAVRRENAVQVRIPRERVIMGDIPAHIKDGEYRE